MENCEICENEFTSLDTHHIKSRKFGGTNDDRNICRICPNCHRLIHTGEIIVEGRYDSCSGNIVVWRNKNEKSVTRLLRS